MPCLIYCDEKAYMGGGGGKESRVPQDTLLPPPATPMLYHDWVENTSTFPSGQS